MEKVKFMNNENLYLYILMRSDLHSMGAGRAAAQASHAANAFIHRYGRSTKAGEVNPLIKNWQNQTPQGFGTAIVLSCDIDKLHETTQKASQQKFFFDTIVDPDYVITVPAEVIPYIDANNLNKFEQSKTDPTKYLFHREEITCAYIFGDKEKLSPLLSGLPLYS